MFLKALRPRYWLSRYMTEVVQSVPEPQLKDDNLPETLKTREYGLDFDVEYQVPRTDYNHLINNVLVNYVSSLKKIPGGKSSLGFFDSVQVYTFMEHVPLTRAADVVQVSHNNFKIHVYDANNAPFIEIGLKKSQYPLEVTRDADNLSVTLNITEESYRQATSALLEDTKRQIALILEDAHEECDDDEEEEEFDELTLKSIQQTIESFNQEIEVITSQKIEKLLT
jgi:ribosome recycling factor